MQQEFDVVIVGAGIAGALIASRLAPEGFRVLLLEAGETGKERVELVGNYARAANKTAGSPYNTPESDRYAKSPDSETDYYEQASDDPNRRFKSFYQRRVGGSTWHWLGNVPRLIPTDFRMKSVYNVGVDWPISYDDLEPWYGEAEWEIGVSGDHEEWDGLLEAYRSRSFPMSKIWPSYSDLQVTPILNALIYDGVPLTVTSTPQARNSQPYDNRPVCAGNSTCVPICPIHAKYDATVHLTRATEAGAVLREKSVVTRLHVREDQYIHRVTYKTWDQKEHDVTGRIVILAAHAVETPKILLMSQCKYAPTGVANSSDQVGRHLMDHLQGSGAALLPQPVFPFRGPPTTSGIDTFRDGAFRAERGAFRMSLGNDGWGRTRGQNPYETVRKFVDDGLFGQALKQAVAGRITRQFRISFSTEMLPDAENRVMLSQEKRDDLGIPKPRLQFTRDSYSKAAFEYVRPLLQRIFIELKAQETDIVLPDPESFSGAGHIMGTCRMGDNAALSVVNKDCQSHDHPNLFIVGSSVFPTGGTANPTLTVAALALRAAATVKEQLKLFPVISLNGNKDKSSP